MVSAAFFIVTCVLRETDLHADDGVDEKDHGDEQADVGQSLSTTKVTITQ